ncbi:hypothetical protein [Stenotrophomonas bentonitica]
MDDVVKPYRPAYPEICLLLMRRFRVPTPGVRMCTVNFPGYTRRDISRSFRVLRRRGVLAVQTVHDVTGEPYAGRLVSLTLLGRLVLNTLEAAPGPISCRDSAGQTGSYS